MSENQENLENNLNSDDILDIKCEEGDTFSSLIEENEEYDKNFRIKPAKNRQMSAKEQKKEDVKEKNRKKRANNRRKVFVQPRYINPNEHELSIVTAGLTEFYKNNANFLKAGESIEDKIKEVIEECKSGWICAADSFIKRVQWKTKWNSASLKYVYGAKDTFYNAAQSQINKDIKKAEKSGNLYSGISAVDLRKTLSNEERKFWQEREMYYKDEFEFNNSSDWPLLMQLLLEELTQYRLMRRRMVDPFDDIEFALSESYKRMIQTQKALGITREQRESAMKETDGNISQLSRIYFDKIKTISKLKERDRIEEITMMRRHAEGEGIDKLPSDLANDIRIAKSAEDMEELNLSSNNEVLRTDLTENEKKLSEIDSAFNDNISGTPNSETIVETNQEIENKQ